MGTRQTNSSPASSRVTVGSTLDSAYVFHPWGVKAFADSATSAADVRAWARENGWEVPERGRVAAEVREAYAAAH